MIDGVASRAFSAETLPPYEIPIESFSDVIIENSRNKYAMPRSLVDKKISEEWLAEADIEEKATRRSEKPLGEVLKPQGLPVDGQEPVFRRKEQFPKREKKSVDINDLKEAIKQSLEKLK